jgi:uncharacterized paraquat-inducible protein A
MKKETLINALRKNDIQNKIDKFGGISSNLQMPSMHSMLKNIKSSFVNNVKSVAQGNSLKVTTEEASARLSICNQCEFFNKEKQRCSKCGCKMAIKTYLKAEKCPLNKW